MASEKFTIGPEKEYDTLRQEILKRIEMQQTQVNLMFTIVAVFLGLGITNNIIAFLIPPIICTMAFIHAGHSLAISKISKYLINNYQVNLSGSNWEEYNMIQSSMATYGKKAALVRLGPVGTTAILNCLSFIVGLSTFEYSEIEWTLLILDILIALLTVYVFFFYSISRLRKI